MSYPPGDFDGSDTNFTAEELQSQPGKFGYLEWWDRLGLRRSKLFVEPDARIEREASEQREIRIEAMKGGFKIEFLGFEEWWENTGLGKPGRDAVPVKLLVIGGKQYKQWSDDFLYVTIQSLPIGEEPRYFIERQCIERTLLGALWTPSSSQAKKKSGADRLPVRRLSKHHYQVKLLRRGWTDLVIEK